MSARVPALLLALAAAPALAQDPAAIGPRAVTAVEYTQGDTAFTPVGFPGPVEFTAIVHHPTDLTAGPFPLVLYLHGRHEICESGNTWPCSSGDPIRSYLGYSYSAQQLASHGYIVISISANGINARDNETVDGGAVARAELIDRHLEFWGTLNTVGAPPFGTQFVGRVDLTRIGTMGHSRGGEGVMRHFSYNAAKPQPFPLKAIVPIAPTNFSRWQVNQDVAVSQLLPYCDGDVRDLQGVHYYDDARYLMTGTGYQSYVTVMGANHNYFNTVWTADDWRAVDDRDPHCSTKVAGNGRLTPFQQRAVGMAYLATFFRTALGNEAAFFGYVDGSVGKPPTVSGFALHVSYHGNDSQRRDLNRLLAAGDLTTNFLGGASSQSGLTPHDLCGGPPPQPQLCLAGHSTEREPHTTPSSRALSLRGLSSLRTGWNASGASYVNQIPAGPARDVSSFGYFQFRASVNFADARNPAGAARDFSVRFTDGRGARQSLRVGQFSGALFRPPGNPVGVVPVPKVLQNAVRLPLTGLTSVDLTDLAEVAVLFDQQPSGAVLLSDLHFYGSRPVLAEMVSPPPGTTFTGSSVTFTWTTGTGVTQYWLWLGTSPGDADIYVPGGPGTATSVTVTDLLLDGRDLYARLWSYVPGQGWLFHDYVYHTAPVYVPAEVVAPPPGSVLGPTATFSWTTGTGVSEYYLFVGSTPGMSDIYAASQGTATSGTVSGLPTDGRTLYVRLWSSINGYWLFRDYIYTAASPTAEMISPPPGTTFSGSSVTFTWTTGTGVTQYWLWVGTSPGDADIYVPGGPGTATSVTVTDLPLDGRELYVRLWSFIPGQGWLFRDYVYRAAPVYVPADMVAPPPGSVLGPTATFSWTTGTGVSEYYLFVGSTPGMSDIYAASQGTATSGTVSGLPTDGRTLYVRLWSSINGYWLFRDYTYRAS